MKKLHNRIMFLLKKSLKKLNGIKFNTGFEITFSKVTGEGKEITETFHLRSTVKEITHESDIFSAIQSQNDYIRRRIDRFTIGGSGWAINRIRQHNINIYHYKLLKAKSYIELPDWINNKLATINIKNNQIK